MNEDLKDLLAAWLGAQLPEDRIEQLKLRIRQDSELREALAEEVALMGQIRAVQSPDMRWLKLEELLEKQIETNALSFEERTMNKIEGRIHRRSLSRSLAWAAAIAVFAAGVWFMFKHKPFPSLPTSPPTVAVVTLTEGSALPSAHQSGERLTAGPLKVDTGFLQIRFLSGATVTIQGPAELDLKSDMDAVVHRGIVVADVPPAAQGFRLQSSQWTAVDQGTIFGIDAADPKHPTVHVLQGKVDLHRDPLAPPDIVLTTGQATRLSTDSSADPISADASRFPNTASLAERSNREKLLRFEAWKAESVRLRKDPSLLIYYDFENADHQAGILPNCAPEAKLGTEGVLVGGDWTSGRWPQKQARRFYRAGDLIRSRPGVDLTEATFMAWVLFENVTPEAPFAIMLSPKVGPRQVYWLVWPTSLSHAATPQIALVKTPARGDDIHYPELSTFSRPIQGRWTHLAVVHDPSGERVRLYSDGVRVADHPIKDFTHMDLEHVVFGNWGFSKDQRNFVGCMDEIAIFSRALSDSEISARFSASHP
jgi:hypothetical protein